jgi:hypothetical protein
MANVDGHKSIQNIAQMVQFRVAESSSPMVVQNARRFHELDICASLNEIYLKIYFVI